MHRTQNPTAPAADTDNGPVVTPADVLRGAATYLETHGWIQGNYYNPDGGAFPAACALGAIGMAAHGCYTDVPTNDELDTVWDCRRAADQINSYLNDIGIGLYPGYDPETDVAPLDVIGWNDCSGQTADHIVGTLRDAADDYDRDHAATASEPTSEPFEVPLLDAGGYLACGCLGTQRDHTCDTSSEGGDPR